MSLYCFSRPGAMKYHTFTDDVAICRAWTRKQAIKKFSSLYTDIQPREVWRIGYIKKVKILTDY